LFQLITCEKLPDTYTGNAGLKIPSQIPIFKDTSLRGPNVTRSQLHVFVLVLRGRYLTFVAPLDISGVFDLNLGKYF
jgi:hypothetical protein